MARKTSNARLISLLDRQALLKAQLDRDLLRLLRVGRRMEKTRGQLRRLAKAIENVEEGWA